MNEHLTNEQNLLILLSRITFTEKNKEHLSILLKKEINWYTVQKYAIKHKVLPLVFNNVTSMGCDKIMGPKCRQVAYFHYLGTKIRNETYMSEMENIKKAFKTNNIPFIPLKGGYLLPYMYKNLGIRIMNDVDCLISKKNVNVVRQIMNSIGYIEGEYDFSNNIINPASKVRKLLWKMKMNNLFPLLKIHTNDFVRCTRYDFSFSLDLSLNENPVEAMLLRAEEYNNGYKLSNSDFLIHLCCHLYKEATEAIWVFENDDLNLIKFCDAREFILKEIDQKTFEKVVEFVKQDINLEKALYYTLFYLREIYNDGYESDYLNCLNLAETFLEEFGKNDFGESVKWKKPFWQRFFSDYNRDELSEKPEFVQKYTTSKEL